jgi:phosphoenolpyruvate carboxylase
MFVTGMSLMFNLKCSKANMKIQEDYEKLLREQKYNEKLIEKLIETNIQLSNSLTGYRVNGHVSHLFGRPLNEVYDIILEHEKNNG